MTTPSLHSLPAMFTKPVQVCHERTVVHDLSILTVCANVQGTSCLVADRGWTKADESKQLLQLATAV